MWLSKPPARKKGRRPIARSEHAGEPLLPCGDLRRPVGYLPLARADPRAQQQAFALGERTKLPECRRHLKVELAEAVDIGLVGKPDRSAAMRTRCWRCHCVFAEIHAGPARSARGRSAILSANL